MRLSDQQQPESTSDDSEMNHDSSDYLVQPMSNEVGQPGWRHEVAVYLRHVIGLVRPGYRPKGFVTIGGPAAATGELEDWSADDVEVLLDEGRRMSDAQTNRLDRVRGTAQVVLPIGLALLVVIGATLDDLRRDKTAWTRVVGYVGWIASLLFVLLAVLGAAAIIVTRAVMGGVLPTLVSQMEPPIKPDLARAYADQMVEAENTINTRLTLQWWAVSFLSTGGLIYVGIWVLLHM